MITKNFRYAVFTVLIVVLQTALSRYINIGGIAPDILAIWVTYLALKEGRLSGTIWGFFVGLGLDLMSGSLIGLSALTKTIGGFTAGYFYDDSKLKHTLGTYRFLLIVFLSSFVQHLVYFVVFTRGSDINIITAIVEFGVTTTLYTTLVSLFPVMIVARRSATVNVE